MFKTCVKHVGIAILAQNCWGERREKSPVFYRVCAHARSKNTRERRADPCCVAPLVGAGGREQAGLGDLLLGGDQRLWVRRHPDMAEPCNRTTLVNRRSLPPARAPQRMLMRTHMSTYLGTEPITAPSHAVALLNRQSMFQRNGAGKATAMAQLGLDPMS